MQPPPRTPEVPLQGGLVAVDIGGAPFSSPEIGFPIPVTALASALASAPPEQQRAVFLYDLLRCLLFDYSNLFVNVNIVINRDFW